MGMSIDGRHLGCGGSHFLSRGGAWGGPEVILRKQGYRAGSWRLSFNKNEGFAAQGSPYLRRRGFATGRCLRADWVGEKHPS